MVDIQRQWPDVYFTYYQSNHEGDLIDRLQESHLYQGVVLNAGGYAHTSVALRDAVADAEAPVVEVHISDIYAREEFRHIDLLTDVCAHSIVGHGTDGYPEAVRYIVAAAQC